MQYDRSISYVLGLHAEESGVFEIIMFFKNQPKENQTKYLEFLEVMGSLSNLFSESATPYLYYRATENLFCICLEAKNLSRSDCSADASKGAIGVGIKTFLETSAGNSLQKIAEFNRKRTEFEKLEGKDLIRYVCKLRNERIEVTKRAHGLEKMIYHYTTRSPGKISILECNLDLIDVGSIKLKKEKGKGNSNTIHFHDNKNEYCFNSSKSTLYKRFYTTDILDEISVKIISDPYKLMHGLLLKNKSNFGFVTQKEEPHVYLPLFSLKGGKHVQEKSALNQWRAGGRNRNPDEVYIPIPAHIHRDHKGFFPDSNKETFELELPNGEVLFAKLCQDKSKGLMSNPNSALGKWLLRTVFQVPEYEQVTLETLERVGVDSVIVYKKRDGYYTIDFANTGSYENFKADTTFDIEED